MNKKELIVKVAKCRGLGVDVVAGVLESILTEITTGESTRIKGFGVFEWVKRREYSFKSKSGIKTTIPESESLKFRASQQLRGL